MQVSKDFILQEFVPKEVYQQFGENSIWFIKPELIKLAQFVKDWFKTGVIINNWNVNGQYNESGYRIPDSKTGAAYSQHKFGTACDFKLVGITDYELIRKEIRKSFFYFHKWGYLTTIEKDTPTWLHCDIRNIGVTIQTSVFEVPYK